jgi:hypothetical protein
VRGACDVHLLIAWISSSYGGLSVRNGWIHTEQLGEERFSCRVYDIHYFT